ncbi:MULTISPECIES: hypothetical protein [unclassified Microbacterium]|jgi:hypothetical protein|uniref:hypothetical protein n=1 Tax=unclassified Microbacterium TaxID=2609290 RepID=UPI003C30DEFC
MTSQNGSPAGSQPTPISVSLPAAAWGAIAGVIAAYGESHKDGAMILAAEEIKTQVTSALSPE